LDAEWIFECVLEYYIKHKASWTEIEDILKLINKIHKNNVIPESKYHFLKKFKRGTKAKYNYKCKNIECNVIKEINSDSKIKSYICECEFENSLNESKPSFVTFSIKDQLQNLIKKYKDLLMFPTSVPEFPIKDVWSGKIHRNLLKKHRNGFLSLTVNTDGMQIFKSSHTSLWPIIICLNNLPLRYRFLQDNLLICGFHYDKNLDMSEYLKPFAMELQEINLNGGIETKYGNLNVYTLLTSLDSPAKAKVQNQKQYNAHYGCCYCKEPGLSIEAQVNLDSISFYKKFLKILNFSFKNSLLGINTSHRIFFLG
jgi:hypothetical protein